MGFLSDLKMGLGLEKQTPDYRERTEKTKAINKAISSGDTSSFKDDPAMMSRYKRESMMDRMGGASDNSGIKSISGGNTPAEEDMSSIYDENRRRYEEFMKSQQPQQPQVTPEMRREALNIFESQQGAGQVPYYMAAARGMMPRDDMYYRQGGPRDQFGMPIVGRPVNSPMQQNPNMSPAFRYAAQNYETLGGSQRLAPRPMEMMSVAERGQINDMAQAMADEQARKRQEEETFRRTRDMILHGGGKGGPRTGPQMPRDPYMPRFGGKGRGGVAPQIPPMRQPPSRQPVPFNPDVVGGGQPNIPPNFGSMLMSRFGRFGS